MKGTRAKMDKATAWPWLTILKAALVSAVLTIAVILLFALLLKLEVVSESWITPINQILKLAGIVLTAFWSTRRPMEKAWLKGGVAGMVYIVLGIVIFAIIQGDMGLNAAMALDVAMGFVAGMLTALILRVKK
jgi:putative membrane protein (TIGR04086 family)